MGSRFRSVAVAAMMLGVVAVVAALGEDARQRLPGLGLAVQARQSVAQAIGARKFAERALEAGDRAMALAGRDVGGRQAGGDLVAGVALGDRQAPVEPLI